MQLYSLKVADVFLPPKFSLIGGQEKLIGFRNFALDFIAYVHPFFTRPFSKKEFGK